MTHAPDGDGSPPAAARPREIGRRIVGLGAALALLLLVASSDRAHALATSLVQWGADLIVAHPVAGVVVFLVVSGASAMLAFFSSVPLVPVAVAAWGEWPTVLLLWSAWWLGGVTSYGLGRGLGERVAGLVVSPATLERYGRVLRRRAGFGTVLVFQAALPSEVPGYVLGTLGYRFAPYALALALAELPYAIGGVFLTEGFLERRYVLLLGAGLALLGGSLFALSRLRRTLDGVDRG